MLPLPSCYYRDRGEYEALELVPDPGEPAPSGDEAPAAVPGLAPGAATAEAMAEDDDELPDSA